MRLKEQFYIIKENALPEIIMKVLSVQQLLKTGEAKTIKEATERIGISRSVFYKYQDSVEPFNEFGSEQTITIGFNLKHAPGILSNALNIIASHAISVLTINQTIPINGIAHVMITMETTTQSKDLNSLLEKLDAIAGMRQLKVIGRSKL
jgi:chorismate mutase